MISDKEISSLSVAERILLIEKIWDSIEPDSLEISSAHQEELARRLKRFNQGKTKFFSWDEIKQDLHSSK